ncbi:MAG: hypothetical protein AVO35_08190 [Candidatus Aegiribacteria sp. MLS_C]|nr:MAG: hypothetical protein AVO35_08190 [Candidatus Aegiribacteria sp. MLS_C]
MEGVYLSCIVPLVSRLVRGEVCLEVDRPVRDGIGLVFRGGTLTLCASPDSPGLIWGERTGMSEPLGNVWADNLRGAVVEEVVQQGFDRVLELRFGTRLLYGAVDTRLIFEATGRNSNIILVRSDDCRVIACTRRVTGDMSRYRTVVPGSRYVPPPPSGLPPGSWASSPELAADLASGASFRLLCRRLEGVGPVTARAILREAGSRGVPVADALASLEKDLLEGRFSPWLGPEGPLPVRLGPGGPLEDPLSHQGPGRVRGIREEKLETWRGILNTRLSRLRSRRDRIRNALDRLVPPEDYRIWGSLLLSLEDSGRKGLEEIRLTDWEGREHTIPLKPCRSLKANASRFFRKASNSTLERQSLESRLNETLAAIDDLESSIGSSGSLGIAELDLKLEGQRRSAVNNGKNGIEPLPRELSEGWRCFVGRNARQNEVVTFRIGKRGDIWLHARGIPGAHVVLKLDGRGENPPAGVIREAAALAASGSGVSTGVIPVDYTRVQYVNRVRNGRTGQVTYSREKTIFIDLGAGGPGRRARSPRKE